MWVYIEINIGVLKLTKIFEKQLKIGKNGALSQLGWNRPSWAELTRLGLIGKVGWVGWVDTGTIAGRWTQLGLVDANAGKRTWMQANRPTGYVMPVIEKCQRRQGRSCCLSQLIEGWTRNAMVVMNDEVRLSVGLKMAEKLWNCHQVKQYCWR